jgi:solute carrier family 41
MLALLFIGIVFPLAYRHVKTRPDELALLSDRAGWGAILTAMAISTGSGLVLERFVTRFKGIAVLAPVINGIGGNLAAVLASKVSTSLHRNQRCVSVR